MIPLCNYKRMRNCRDNDGDEHCGVGTPKLHIISIGAHAVEGHSQMTHNTWFASGVIQNGLRGHRLHRTRRGVRVWALAYRMRKTCSSASRNRRLWTIACSRGVRRTSKRTVNDGIWRVSARPGASADLSALHSDTNYTN